MFTYLFRHKLSWVLILLVLSACGTQSNPVQTQGAESAVTEAAVEIAPAASATIPAEQTLTICMGSEPRSLFLYSDSSLAARNIRQAIYDGPVEYHGYEPAAILLEQLPDLQNGNLSLAPLEVDANALVTDITGAPKNLAEGVSFFPTGCRDASCAQVYQGTGTVSMDQMVVRFTLKDGLTWSDSTALTAGDSLYSYEVARKLNLPVMADLLQRTHSYQALDDKTIEWRGIPGLVDSSYLRYFFSPLPRHAWGSLDASALAADPLANQTPLGWGAYVIQEWLPGDRISLAANSNYFRHDENLPAFDRLVYRFIPSVDQAMTALQQGECDLLDDTYDLDPAQLNELAAQGRLQVLQVTGAAWEHLDFGIAPFQPDPNQPVLVQSKEIRQAVALCLDRTKLAEASGETSAMVLDSYLPGDHPLFNPSLKKYAYDPAAGAALLESAGWKDLDGDPATPRTSVGAAGVYDGTPLSLRLHFEDPAQTQSAQMIQLGLAQCGIQVQVEGLPAETLYAPGPDGVVFGRQFELVQFAWASAGASWPQPPCWLYTSQEIPGPSSAQYPRGWGGANLSGYSNPQFDLACQKGLGSLPGTPENMAAHYQAQAIFAEELPVLPLYSRSIWLAARPDLCGLPAVSPGLNMLWGVESINIKADCDS